MPEEVVPGREDSQMNQDRIDITVDGKQGAENDGVRYERSCAGQENQGAEKPFAFERRFVQDGCQNQCQNQHDRNLNQQVNEGIQKRLNKNFILNQTGIVIDPRPLHIVADTRLE